MDVVLPWHITMSIPMDLLDSKPPVRREVYVIETPRAPFLLPIPFVALCDMEVMEILLPELALVVVEQAVARAAPEFVLDLVFGDSVSWYAHAWRVECGLCVASGVARSCWCAC